ncbi:MAG: hypothetical protein AAB074_00240 [Planctomycetota bacterium]
MRLARIFPAIAASAALAALMATAAGTPPPHVTRLDTLVADLRAQTLAGLRFNGTGDTLNDHVNGHLALWKEDGNPFAENRSLCNQVVTIALKKGWGTTDAAWKAKTGYDYPSSEHFYSSIRDGKGFVRITALDDVLPGDVIALWYVDDPSSSYPSTTGHTMVVRTLAPVIVYKFPKKSTTVRFRDLEVYDSSNSGHSMDTRSFLAGELGGGSAATEWKGAGRGWMRIYVDGAGKYLGYTWSMTGTKTQPPGTPPSYTYYSKNFKSEALRHFIVGRYLP